MLVWLTEPGDGASVRVEVEARGDKPGTIFEPAAEVEGEEATRRAGRALVTRLVRCRASAGA